MRFILLVAAHGLVPSIRKAPLRYRATADDLEFMYALMHTTHHKSAASISGSQVAVRAHNDLKCDAIMMKALT